MSDIYHSGEMYTPRKNQQKAQNRIKKLEAELKKFKEPVKEIPQSDLTCYSKRFKMNEKLKEVLKQAVLVCEYRAGDVSTEDGDFATTDIDSIIRLEEALCDALDAPSDDIRMLDVFQKIQKL